MCEQQRGARYVMELRDAGDEVTADVPKGIGVEVTNSSVTYVDEYEHKKEQDGVCNNQRAQEPESSRFPHGSR